MEGLARLEETKLVLLLRSKGSPFEFRLPVKIRKYISMPCDVCIYRIDFRILTVIEFIK